jgi:glycosyltransferase 2 family protein
LPGSRFARPVGIVFALLCVAFFVNGLLAVDTERLASLPLVKLLMFLAVWSLGYATLLAGVTMGFVQLVQVSGHPSATPIEGLAIWGKANMAKYLPGNVLHFAGRQVIGARYGWPQGSIATASLLEVGLQVVLPCGLAVLLLILFGRLAMLKESGNSLAPLLLLVTAVMGLAVAGPWLRRWLPRRLLLPLANLKLPSLAAVLPPARWYLAFFVGMSLIVWWLYALVAGYIEFRQLPVLAAAFLISWVMGFIIPGAPGGIGVREGSFAAMGAVFLNPDALVVVAVLMRLVTLVGEGLIFLLALQAARVRGSTATEPQRLEIAGNRRRS